MPKQKTIKTGAQFRAVRFDADTIDVEARTVDIAFSSEEPVRRWYGLEILDHKKGAADLTRLNNGGALLIDHDWRDHVGVIENASIDPDKVGRALVRFGNSARASEIFQDVQDGIRTKISFGYAAREMILEKETEDGPDEYRVTDWEPYEISFVSVPADDSVGVGRTMAAENFARNFGDLVDHETRVINPLSEDEDTTMPKKVIDNAGGNASEIDVEAVAAEARTAAQTEERTRVDGIVALADKYNLHDMARTAITAGTTLSDFRETVLDKVESTMTDNAGSGDTLPEEEMRNYSLFNAIRAQITGDWSKAGFERKVSIACVERMGGKDPRGFYVPFEAMTRIQSVGTANKGGDLVATELLDGSFIEMLRATSLSGLVGVTYLPGLVGNVDVPKQTVGGSFGWIAEDAASAATDITVGKVSLTPETISGSVYMTRRSLMQTTPAIEGLVRDDIIKGLGLAMDQAIFEGAGAANVPLGVANQSGINTQTIAANATTGYPTWAEMVGFETAVETDNALADSMHFVTTPAIYGGMRTTVVDSGSGQFLPDKIGYPIHRCTQLDAQRILFGNFSDVLVGLWGALDINVDQATDAAKGGLWLRAFQDANVAIRHAESFCKNSLPA